MRLMDLLHEVWSVARTDRIASTITAIVVAATCAAVAMTVGRSAATLARVAAQMDDSGARRITVVDSLQQGSINPTTLTAIREASVVQDAIALGQPFDCTNGRLGTGGPRVAAWPVLGGLSAGVDIVMGRLPGPGEAVVSTTVQQQLGMELPTGYVVDVTSGRQYPVVGAYRARVGQDDLQRGALVSPVGEVKGREVRVTITDIGSAKAAVEVVTSILAFPSAEGVHIDSPVAAATRARELARELASSGSQTLATILSAGGLFVAVVTLSDVLVRRRDLGRRRTLGISRANLVALVVGTAVVPAVVGALLGSVGALLWGEATRTPVPPAFVVSTAFLAVLVSGLSALVPAIYAATRDPVAVLRTP